MHRTCFLTVMMIGTQMYGLRLSTTSGVLDYLINSSKGCQIKISFSFDVFVERCFSDEKRRKPVALGDQVVTDKQGRRRFHGAFTGGFSAGYFNSVGTKEGL